MTCKVCGEAGGGVTYTAPGGKFVTVCHGCWQSTDVVSTDMAAYREEELARLKDQNRCMFDVSWLGFCGDITYEWYKERYGEHVGEGHPLCEHHKTITCSNSGCDNQAVGECDATSQFVCGYPYCAECGAHLRCYPKEENK